MHTWPNYKNPYTNYPLKITFNEPYQHHTQKNTISNIQQNTKRNIAPGTNRKNKLISYIEHK